jgi:hypothetical protein
VYGDARVSGNALVSGNAQVSGNAWETTPLQIHGTKHVLTNSAHGKITIGCHTHDFAYWEKHYRAIGHKEGYTEEQIAEYGGHIVHIVKFGK